MFKNIIFVCVGNICRSPMAEAVFKRHFLEREKLDRTVHSAGLGALVGHPADEKACQLMLSRGLDISGHRARQLDSQMIRQSDIILVMELAHKLEIEHTNPFAKGKVFRLGECGGFDIEDPYQEDLQTFERVLNKIDRGVSDWMKKICP